MITNILQKFPITNNAKRETNGSEEDHVKPFIQWVGGKREMIPQYKEFIPKKFGVYYEPFIGGGAMFFYLQPQKAILGDNSLELIKAYEGVRDNPHIVIEILKDMKKKHSKELYSKIRDLDREINIFEFLNSAEIAARLIYLNQTCFNGVYRVNKKSQFNVPIGSSLNRLICDKLTLLKASKSLKRAEIKCEDFTSIIKMAKHDDFVYFDPPYFPISVYSDFTRYTKEKFYKEDQVRLKDTTDELTKRGCKVMLSNSDCEFINNLYKKYRRIKVSSNRTLNSRKEKRGKVTELLILNY